MTCPSGGSYSLGPLDDRGRYAILATPTSGRATPNTNFTTEGPMTRPCYDWPPIAQGHVMLDIYCPALASGRF
jgi:hypothetical protein